MRDFRKLQPQNKVDLPLDPYDIFRKNVSKMGSSGINDLWAGQRDALREWNECRAKNDLALVLNTGAGKTLIGLLIGQSLVNETKGKVFYLCGSIQLIDQTREKAEMYGLAVTTYHSGNFSNHHFNQGNGVCITTYQALFNGRSKFRNDDIAAIIFDDSHTAENLIKNCFSIEISQHTNESVFNDLIQLFRPYYRSLGRLASFDELLTGKYERVELLPPFEVSNNVAEIRAILERGDVAKNTDTLFSWHYLKDHLDLCSYFVSAGSIQITPPFVPVDSLPYFSTETRRVYLTATLLGEDNFIRTFGRPPDQIIVPETPAGECERQILFPLLTKNIVDDRVATQTLVQEQKALVITPNNYVAARWKDIAAVPPTNLLTDEINKFKVSSGKDKIIITARYDGIDLPGDTCRVLVLDSLPMGAALIDKYQWSALRLSNTLRSLVACRVIQSLGRISRGMSDYGVVIVCDKNYVEWLQNSRNRAFLPSFIQKQLQLGVELSSDTSGVDELSESIDACLSRSTNWLEGYENFMEASVTEVNQMDKELLVGLAAAEMSFISHYWNRDYNRAAKKLINVINDAESVNVGLAAWYACWIAQCCDKAGDSATSSFYYKKSNGLSRAIPRYIVQGGGAPVLTFSDQVKKIGDALLIAAGNQVVYPSKIKTELKFLDGSGTVNQTEQALMDLGKYLGFESIRPDNEHNAGPDILWIDSGVALALEAKTEKDSDYKKDEVGQLLSHVEWVKDHYPEVKTLTPLFVGPVRRATSSASPSDDISVCELNDFHLLGERLDLAYQDVAHRAMPISLNQDVFKIINDRRFLVRQIIAGFNLTQLKSLS